MNVGGQLIGSLGRTSAVIALVFGAVELAYGIYLLETAGHALFLGITYVVPGLILLALGAVILLGVNWAVPLAFVSSLFPTVVPFLWYDLVAGRSPIVTWQGIVGLGVPAIFLILTLLLMVSRGATPSDRRSIGTTPKARGRCADIRPRLAVRRSFDACKARSAPAFRTDPFGLYACVPRCCPAPFERPHPARSGPRNARCLCRITRSLDLSDVLARGVGRPNDRRLVQPFASCHTDALWHPCRNCGSIGSYG